MEPDTLIVFVTVGGLLLAGVATDVASRWIPLPRITLLVLLGVVVGPGALDLLPPQQDEWFPIVSTIALTMIGFLVGGEFTHERLRKYGSQVVAVATIQAVATAALMVVGLLVVGFDPVVALPLAGIAAATAPASTVAIVQDRGSEGWLSRTILGVVALDDVITIVLFSLLLSGAGVLAGTDGQVALLGTAAWEIGGAVLLALVLAAPMAYLTGRLEPGEPTREEALGIVLVSAGLAEWIGVSFLLTAVVLGALVANLASHHERPFREIEAIEWPFMVVFFVLAGAQFRISGLVAAGALGVAYVGFRVVGKVTGGYFAARVVAAPRKVWPWFGTSLLPQAGVALGLALLAAEELPDAGPRIMAVVVTSTVLFAIVGPALTAYALDHVDD
ncbi:MAG: cation:proton antiporter [Acidimicrobiales bacterium]|nr:cation:proton antiporter [Acidimicrobiales bacterium]